MRSRLCRFFPKHMKLFKRNRWQFHRCLQTRNLRAQFPLYRLQIMSQQQDWDNHCKWAAGLREPLRNLSSPSGGGCLEPPAVSVSSQWCCWFVFSSSRRDSGEWMKWGEAAIIFKQGERSQKNRRWVEYSPILSKGSVVSMAMHQFTIELQSDGSGCNKVELTCLDQSNAL